MLKEFQKFIARGNVVDLAVGIIIGAAFTAIVNSLVTDLINPIIGVITGGIDFSNLYINLGKGEYPSLAAAKEAGAPVFAYGSFITAVINFLIVAWAVFLLVQGVNKLQDTFKAQEAAKEPEPTGPSELDVLKEIRDELKARPTA